MSPKLATVFGFPSKHDVLHLRNPKTITDPMASPDGPVNSTDSYNRQGPRPKTHSHMYGSGQKPAPKITIRPKKKPKAILLDSAAVLTPEDVVAVARYGARVNISSSTLRNVKEIWNGIQENVRNGKAYYGITRAVGDNKDIPLTPEQAVKFSLDLIHSHARGVGDTYFSVPEVRAAMLVLAKSLSEAHSCIRPSTLKLLVAMLNKGITPCVREKGSIGSSGDLIPLAQIARALLGEGKVYDHRGVKMRAKAALEKAGLEPVTLQAGEGLTLINGTMMMTGLAALNVYDASRLFKTSLIAAGFITEILYGDRNAYAPILFAVRKHKEHAIVAADMLALTEGSELLKETQRHTQAPYSLRSIPQVMGTTATWMARINEDVLAELNSCTGNPIFYWEGEGKNRTLQYRSGAGFHGQPIAIAMDFLKIIMSELGDLSFERVNRLLNPYLNEGLNSFLVPVADGRSGCMIDAYALLAEHIENIARLFPVSALSKPVSNNQEDNNSMGTIAARWARDVLRDAEWVVAIELIDTAIAADLRFTNQDTRLSDIDWYGAYAAVRHVSKKLTEDRDLEPDMQRLVDMIRDDNFVPIVEKFLSLKY